MLLQELVDQDFGITGRGKWYHSDDHDSLVVNADNQTWFWNSKGIRGDILDYLVLVRGMSKTQAKIFLKNSFGELSNSEEKSRPNPYEKLVDVFWEHGKTKRDYWYRRCLKDEFIDRYKLGYYDGWNTIPIYENDEFVNFQMRRDTPEKRIFYRYRSGRLFLFNSFILPFTNVIYITEGLVDAILLYQEGFPSVAAGGVNSWDNAWFEKFSHIKDIYYIEDNDTAGRIGAKSVAKCLGVHRVKIVSFPDKKEKYDTGDFFKDGGTKEQFKEYVENNHKYLFELE